MDAVKMINTIEDLHTLFGYQGPHNAYITLINLYETHIQEELRSTKFSLNLYTITMKKNKDCWLKYGRQVYDFSAGSLLFTSPGQVLLLESIYKDLQCEGWMLCFHPDLIRNTHIEKKMDDYTYFSYDTFEALHLSNDETRVIDDVVDKISQEYTLAEDVFSAPILLSYIEVLLSYSSRFYGRQFETRMKADPDYLVRLEHLLKEAFASGEQPPHIPTVKDLARQLGYSPNYLSDMLRKETGQTASEHIQRFMLDRAKSLLADKTLTINEISYLLGFEQQANFSKFFKGKEGVSPSQFRRQQNA